MVNLWFNDYVDAFNLNPHNFETEERSNLVPYFLETLRSKFDELQFTYNIGTNEIILITEV